MNPPKKYTTGARALLDALQGSEAQAWSNTWSRYLTSRLADYAFSQIDFATGELCPAFIRLDDPCKRSELVKKDSVTIEDRVDRLMQSNSLLNNVLDAAKIHSQSKVQLRRLLNEGGVVSALIDTPRSVAILTDMDAPAIWTAIADKIAQQIHSSESSYNRDPEWLLWNKLLLSRFFYSCQLSSAQQMSGQLKTLIRGFHGPRSSLLAITEQISSSGIVDPLLPPVSGTARPRSGLKGIRLSDLFGAIQNEYGQMQCGNGIVHRTVEPNAVALIPAELRGRLTQSQLATFRDQAYRQHEAAILSYGALSAIEQLLRSLASHVGIHHLNSDGTPKSVGYWLDDTRLGLAPGLLALLQELYSANGPNLRNRVMHAGLLETSSRSLEVILAANLSGRDPTPSKDPYVAENLLKVFMRDLEELDAHVDATGINTSDFSWAASLWLSPVRSRSVIGFDAIYSILMKARPGGLNCSALLIGLFHVLPPTAEWPGWTSSSLTTA